MTIAQGWAYFDTSVLLKNYIDETGSVQARGLLQRHLFISSAITPLEALSALYRRKSAGELDDKVLTAILVRIRDDRLYWNLVEANSQTLSRAEDLIQRTDLRALDAIHISSMMTIQAALGARIPFITGDRHQYNVAEQLSLHVMWVGS